MRRAIAVGASGVVAAAYFDERVRRRLVIPVVGGCARAFVRGGNHLTLHDAHHLHAGLDRPAGTAMLSVSNHISTMDDPGMLASIVPIGTLLDPDAMRWGVCAEDVCFEPGSWLHRCASTAKVLPVRRGAGIWHEFLDVIESKLLAGEWVHYFPEGKISQDGAVHSFRRGVGRLAAAVNDPRALVILPFYHTGAEQMQPTSPTATSVFSLPRLGSQAGSKRPPVPSGRPLKHQVRSGGPPWLQETPQGTSGGRPDAGLEQEVFVFQPTGTSVHVIFGAPVDLSPLLARRAEPPFDRRPELLYEAIALTLEAEVRDLQCELRRRLERAAALAD